MTHSSNLPPADCSRQAAQLSATATGLHPVRLAPELGTMFPPGVVAAELQGEGDPALLCAQEMQVTERFAPKRKREFAAGRACARLALARLGIEGFSLLPAEDRQPRWPSDIVGSITHTEGYCAAVVARSGHVRSLGVDCELKHSVHAELWPRICGPAELAWLEQLPPEQRTAAAGLVFSAKESFYKCQYALTAEWLPFSAVAIEVLAQGAAGGAFLVRARRPLRLEASAQLPLRGHFRFHGDWVTTGLAVP
jgi:4'-phosphopantetheinyl transferase EntD